MSATVPEVPDVVKLDLSVGQIHTVEIDGKPYVVFRPAVESLGLAYAAQLIKITGRTWANRSVIDTVAQDGKIRHMVCVDVRTFLMWSATVHENKVKDSVRETLIAFQCETADAIESYWTRGGAINPRATDDQLADMQTELEALRELRDQWNILVARGEDFSVREAAAILNRDHNIVTGQNMLFELMRRWEMLDSRNRLYADHKQHLVWRMGREYVDEHGDIRIGGSQVRVTPMGMLYLHRRLRHALA